MIPMPNKVLRITLKALEALFAHTLRRLKCSTQFLLMLWSRLQRLLRSIAKPDKPNDPPTTHLVMPPPPNDDPYVPIRICASQVPSSLHPDSYIPEVAASADFSRGRTELMRGGFAPSLITLTRSTSPQSHITQREARPRSRVAPAHPNVRPQVPYRQLSRSLTPTRGPRALNLLSSQSHSVNSLRHSVSSRFDPSLRPISIQAPSIDINHSSAGGFLSSPHSIEIDIQTQTEGSEEIREFTLSTIYPDFYPISPLDVSRYDRPILKDTDVPEFVISPLTTSFTTNFDPMGWSIFTHPEGARYFFHDEQRILTEADLYDPDTMSQMNRCIGHLNDFIREHIPHYIFGSDTDIVLDLVQKNDEHPIWRCNYYFVSHSSRSIFWLDVFDPSAFGVWAEVRGVSSLPHIGHITQSLYWYHCHMYPNILNLTIKIVDELRSILLFSCFDSMLSLTTTAPYNTAELQQMISMTNSMRKCPDAGPGVTSSICRMMYIFVEQRFLNWHGEKYARLDRDHSVHGDPLIMRRTLLISTLSPLLFVAPDVHLRQLQKTYVDGILHITSWLHLINKLSTEWQEFILYATVLLNANVAFLSINSVDNSTVAPGRSAALIMSYLSIVFSIGSIIMGLLLVRQNRTKNRESASDAVNFLYRKSKSLGMETLAILYSLPYALVMWATLTFLGAFSSITFTHSDSLVDLIIGIAWFIVGVFIMWSIITSWERHHENGILEDALKKMLAVLRYLFPYPESHASTTRVSDSGSTTAGKTISNPWQWVLPIYNIFRRESVDSGQTAIDDV